MHVDGSRSRELADETLARGDTRHDTTRRHTLNDVFRVPGHEVPVVNNVLLAIDELGLTVSNDDLHTAPEGGSGGRFYSHLYG